MFEATWPMTSSDAAYGNGSWGELFKSCPKCSRGDGLVRPERVRRVECDAFRDAFASSFRSIFWLKRFGSDGSLRDDVHQGGVAPERCRLAAQVHALPAASNEKRIEAELPDST